MLHTLIQLFLRGFCMKLSYDPSVDALYIRLIDAPAECEVLRINANAFVSFNQKELHAP